MAKKLKKPYSKIKELREQQGLTQKELANEIQVTATSVANWENDRSLLDKIETISKLCLTFECEVHDLIGYRDEEIKEPNAKDERIKKIRERIYKKQQEQTDK